LGSRRRRAAIDAAALLWLGTSIAFWAWWADPDHVVTGWGFAANTAVLALEFAVMPVWFLLLVRRARRPDRRGPLPALRTGLVVTRAPSEPWPLVRGTLEALLAQDADVPFEVWLADEAPTPAVSAWCAEHGVGVTTRAGHPDYHRETWPRRRRCKEGNLAFFYDHVGYERFDVVCQFDADHVPEPGYLRCMLRAFEDPRVGYVAAPSICDTNAAASWAARGRLFLEAGLHGPAQAGANEGLAPSCIGSHYAVRTRALREAGGIGPELAEDFSTSMLIASHGWRGAFAPDAIAHGEGPPTAAAAMTQELQWSRSMMVIALRHAGPALRRLPLPARLRLGGCLAWYPLAAGALVVAHALAPVALLTGTPIVAVPLGAFFAHLAPCVAAMLLVLATVRGAGWLRPADVPLVSWEAPLFLLLRWPWAALGCAQAVVVALTGRALEWKVTPKGAGGPEPLPLRLLAPPLLLAVVSVAPVLLVDDPGAAGGYLLWAMVNGVLYLGVAVAVVLLHLREQRGALRGAGQVLRLARVPALASVLVLGVVAPGVAVGGPDLVTVWRAPVHERPAVRVLAVAPGSRGPRVGVTTRASASFGSVPDRVAVAREVRAWERAARARADIVQVFVDFRAPVPRVGAVLRDILRRGSVPQLTWEPWDHRRGLRVDQPEYALRRIAAGRHDAHLRAMARMLAAQPGRVLVRFAHEMDGVAYPWSERRSGNRRGDFVRAWRHVHAVLRRAGARNVRLVWSPLATAFDTRLWPGRDVVDVVGLSGFNGGDEVDYSGWRSFASIFRPAFRKARRLAPGLPVQVSEVASAELGGDKARWITGMWRTLDGHPEVTSVLWFDVRKEADWPITSSAAARAAFADGLHRLRARVLPRG
jgi:cellulose synthase/poly-beta-1,6-N-acetylglucosamine synthase-like glycosyltransferase